MDVGSGVTTKIPESESRKKSRVIGYTDHGMEVGRPEIGINQEGPMPLLGKPEAEIPRQEALARTPFATPDWPDVRHLCRIFNRKGYTEFLKSFFRCPFREKMPMDGSFPRGWQVKFLCKPERPSRKDIVWTYVRISEQQREIPLISRGHFKTIFPIAQDIINKTGVQTAEGS
jgi:hypothetical protein